MARDEAAAFFHAITGKRLASFDKGVNVMGKIPSKLRETIARNIRECRQKKYPGRGGAKKCAEAFSTHIGQNISPQQWSPWECGMRTPEELRLEQMAKFFDVTVEYLRKDHRQPIPGAPSMGVPSQAYSDMGRNLYAELPPLYSEPPPGSAESFFRLARHLVSSITADGILIRLDRDSVELLLSLLSKNGHRRTGEENRDGL